MSTMTDETRHQTADQTPAAAPDRAAARPAGNAAASTQPSKEDQRRQWLGLARTLGLDVLGPILLHSQLTKHGFSEVNALMIAGALPVVGIALDKVRGRRIGGLSIIVLAGIALSIVLGLLSGDARTVLLEGGLNSLGMGLFCLLTLFTRRTVVELFAGGAGGEDTEQGRRIEDWFTRDDVRRLARRVTVVFALVFLASAAIQFALATWAPIDLAFAYNRFGFIPCLLVIGTASLVLFRRARARGELAGL